MEYDYDESGETSAGYWAADPSPERVAAEIAARVTEHYEQLDEAGMLELYRAAHSTFYGLDSSGHHTSSKVIEFGEQGERLGVKSNQMRSLTRWIHMTATQNKPAIKPRAINSTPEAMAQVPTARRLLEFYDRVIDIDRVYNSVALKALLYGKGYVWQAWDPFAGQMGPDGKPQGDLIARAGSPLDMISDLDIDDNRHDWFIARVRRNRHDQVAMYAQLSPEGAQDPKAVQKASELSAKLLAAPQDLLTERMSARLDLRLRKKRTRRSDTVFEYHLMHRKTAAVPEGRYVIIAADMTVLFHGDLPYDTLPVDVMDPEEFLEMGGVGYSSAWDLLGMQALYDAAMSICATNMDAFGIMDVLIPEGVEIGSEELRDGLNIVRYPMGEGNRPEVLEKFSLKREFFEFKDWIKGDMETQVGVNSVARGEPQASLESGSALALVQAQAVQGQAPFINAFNKLVANSSTTRLKILQRHLPPERTIAIAGADDPDSIQAFTSGQVSLVDRVDVEAVGAAFATIAGKEVAADKLLERQLIRSPQAYIHFRETGRLELATDDERRQDLLGRRVREILQQGPEVTTIPGPPDPITGLPTQKQVVPTCRYILTDHPKVCLDAAASVLDSFELRQDEKILAAVTAYMSELLTTWRGTDPDTLALLGYPQPTTAMARKAPQPAKPAANAAQPGAPKEPGAPKALPAPSPQRKPVDQQAPAEGSSMPSLPKPAENPL